MQLMPSFAPGSCARCSSDCRLLNTPVDHVCKSATLHRYALCQHSREVPGSTAQHSTAQQNTAKHSKAQQSKAKHSKAQHSTAWRGTAQHGTAQEQAALSVMANSQNVQDALGGLPPLERRPTLDLQSKHQLPEGNTAAEKTLQLQLLAKMTGHVVTYLPNPWQLVQVRCSTSCACSHSCPTPLMQGNVD